MNVGEEYLKEERKACIKDLFVMLLTKVVDLSSINLPKGVRAHIDYDRIRLAVENFYAAREQSVQAFIEEAKAIPAEDFVTIALYLLGDKTDAPLKNVIQHMESDGNYASNISVSGITRHYVARILGERMHHHFLGLLGVEGQ